MSTFWLIPVFDSLQISPGPPSLIAAAYIKLIILCFTTLFREAH